MKAGLLIKSLALTAVLCMAGDIQAQFGVGARYSGIQDGYWNEVFNDGYTDQLVGISGLYWFRLKKKRVEFLPEIGYYHSLNTEAFQSAGVPTNMQAFYLQFNTDLYFLDFGSDCNCPTFSKDGDVLQRGIFLEISPGVEFRKLGFLTIDTQTGEQVDYKFSKTVPKIYGGLGFDIGISDLVTVTPYAGMAMVMNTAWEEVEDFYDVNPESYNQTGRDRDLIFTAGFRVLFRPDYLYKRR